MENTKSLTSEEFVKLYTSQDSDEKITPIKDAVGFSLVRNYPKDSDYFKDGKKMFIKIFLAGDSVCGGVDMVYPNDKEGNYTIVSDEKYKKNVTGFLFRKEEDLVFDFNEKEIVYTPKKLRFSVDKFIKILVNNHLSDRMFWRRMGNYFTNIILMFLFWLSDQHYEKIQVMLDIYSSKQDNNPDKIDTKNIEPFFKYFLIRKNALLLFLVLLFPTSLIISYISVFSDYSLSDPSLILFFFLSLSSLEKISIWLDKKIKALFKKEDNFIYKLHDYQYNTHFKLKFK
ncbi:MAG: hypothetical protein AAB377_00690 [Patescibacteria group bacterium]